MRGTTIAVAFPGERLRRRRDKDGSREHRAGLNAIHLSIQSADLVSALSPPFLRLRGGGSLFIHESGGIFVKIRETVNLGFRCCFGSRATIIARLSVI